MKKICIIGHFGFGKNLLNGQTIKTKIITAEIEKQFGEKNIFLLDLAGGVKKIPSLLIKIPIMLARCSNLIMMPVENGLMFLTPVLRFWNAFFKRKLHYVVIGGWLPEFLKRRKLLRKMLQKFGGIYVETQTMKKALEEQGFSNVLLMPNCKELTPLKLEELVDLGKEPYKLCTFSRVMKEKGIADAVDAVKTVNEQLGRTVYELDIYGQIDSNQMAWFADLQKSLPEYVQYKGQVPFDKSMETLKNYFALLFPTRFYTEGIPGTIIDAYAAGVPVISAKWESFADVVEDGYTGLGYEFNNLEKLQELLIRIAVKPDVLSELRINCLEKYTEYKPETVIRKLIEEISG